MVKIEMEMPKSCAKCPFKWTDSESVDVCDIFYKLGKYYLCDLCHNTANPNWQYELCPLKDLKEEPTGNKEFKEITEDIAEVLFHILYPKANYDLHSANDNDYWTTIMKASYVVKKVSEMKE